MPLLIDGYNLLHVTGIFGRGPGSLERSRRALLNFLAESLEPEELSRTTVVFDARHPPPGLPREVTHRGITVLYASDYDSADELLEARIRAETSPRKLTVVSSDHRLHRAARKRRATAVDSDVWYEQIVRRRGERRQQSPTAVTKPDVPLAQSQIEHWLRVFRADEAALLDDGTDAPASADQLSDDSAATERASPTFNPFPPGYAEDAVRAADETPAPKRRRYRRKL